MENYMKVALKEAQKAYIKREVPVGAVIVKDNKIVAKAHNLKEKKQSALAHAELICIEKASKKLGNWRLEECDMYVTLKPCPMCESAINQTRIQNVYYGAIDKNNEDSNSNFCFIENDECSEILKKFFGELRKK